MVLQDTSHVVSQSLGNGLAFFLGERNTAMFIVNTNFSVQIAGIYSLNQRFDQIIQDMLPVSYRTLSEHFHRLPERTPRLAVNPMSVSSSNDIRASLVDFGMNHETSLVDHSLVSALAYKAFVVNQNQVRCFDKRKVLCERVDPEVIFENRI